MVGKGRGRERGRGMGKGVVRRVGEGSRGNKKKLGKCRGLANF